MAYYIALAITLITAITVHEFAHAYMADQLGDDLPRSQGRVTLNPLAHLDPFGSLMFIVAGFGWGKPVMTNPYNLRPSPRIGMAIVAAAGPFSNFCLAIIGSIPFRLNLLKLTSLDSEALFPSPSYLLFVFILANLGLMLFNLIPLAPLDGSKIAIGFLPDEWARGLASIEQYGPIILMLLVFSGRFGFDVFGILIGPAQNFLLTLLLGR